MLEKLRRKRKNVLVPMVESSELADAKKRHGALMDRVGIFTEQEEILSRDDGITEDILDASRRLGRLEAMLGLLRRES